MKRKTITAITPALLAAVLMISACGSSSGTAGGASSSAAASTASSAQSAASVSESAPSAAVSVSSAAESASSAAESASSEEENASPDAESASSVSQSISSAAESAAPEEPAAENEYIRIGQYEGIRVARVEGLPVITDTAVDNNINVILKGFAEHSEVDRAAKEGDSVTIDYTVSVNGEDFPEGGASGYQMTVGDISMFKGFSATAEGHKAGDTWDVSHDYADTYAVAALAGQNAVFHIKLVKVEEIKIPRLTDDFVQKVSTKSKNVEEYREEVRSVLEGNNHDYMLREIRGKVWQSVLDTVEVKQFPEDMLQEEIDAFYDYYQEGAEFYDMSFEDFLKEMEISPEHFEEEAAAAAESNVRENLAAALIAEKAGLDLSEEVMTAEKEDLAESLRFDSVEELVKDAPNEEYVNRMAVRELVMDWCADHAEQVDKEDL